MLYASDVDAEFQNVKNNMIATVVEGYSSINNVFSQSRATAEIDPAPSGVYANCVDNQTVAGEIEKLRFVVHRIINGNLSGTTYASVPAKSLSSGSSLQLAWYLPFTASTQGHAWQNTIRRGAIANALSYSALNFSSSSLSSSTYKFSTFGYTLGALNVLAYPGKYNQPDQSTLGVNFYNISAGDYLFYNPLLGVQLYMGGSGVVIASIRTAAAATASTKAFETVTGNTSIIGKASWNSAMISYLCNSGTTDGLALYLNGTVDSTTPITGTSIPINADGNGGVWFVGAKPNDPSWSVYNAMSSAPSSNGWTSVGTATSETTSGGIWDMSTLSNTYYYYYNSTDVNLIMSSATFEIKARCLQTQSAIATNKFTGAAFWAVDGNYGGGVGSGFTLVIGTSFVFLQAAQLSLSAPSSFTQTNQDGLYIPIDGNTWHVYRITSSGSTTPTITLYIDGVNVGSFVNAISGGTGEGVGFGAPYSTGQAHVQVEWVAYSIGVYPPIAGDTSGGFLDDVFSSYNQVTDPALLLTLGTLSESVSETFSTDAINGITLPSFPFVNVYDSNSFVNFTSSPFSMVGDGISKVSLSSSIVGALTGSGGGEVISLSQLCLLKSGSNFEIATPESYSLNLLNASGNTAAMNMHAVMTPPSGINTFGIRTTLTGQLILNYSCMIGRA